MRVFSLKKEHLDLLKKTFEKYFSPEDKVKVYLFGSRAKGTHKDYSDIDLAFRSKDKNLNQIIDKIKIEIEDSDFPYKLDLLNWDEILTEYLPSIKKQKIPFWDPSQIKVYSPWRICPIGKHRTRQHPRHYRSGKIGTQSGHCKTNPSGKDLLKGDEIEAIPDLNIFKQALPKVSKDNLGFGANGTKYDELITGWTAYWNDVFKVEPPLHPNTVKALIASESGFKPSATAKNNKEDGDARGLIQITEKTYRILQNRKGELKNNYIELKKDELWDANKNICASIRWLFQKRKLAKIKLRRDPTWEEVLWEYKGILKQSNENEKVKKVKETLRKYLNLINHSSDRNNPSLTSP